MQVPIPSGRVRFGVFEVKLRSGELHKHGIKVKLHDQPFQILAMLLEHAGEVVTREQLRQKLWPADTFVDFDVGLNSAVKKLRDALGDSVEKPRFVETLPRRGYRFIAAVESIASALPQDLTMHAEDAVSVPRGTLPMRDEAAHPQQVSGARWPRKLWITAGALAVILALLGGLNAGRLRQRFLRTSGAGRIQSIAVLPLENLTGDTSQEYFADGMTDALITDLARLSSLRVISRTSAMHYNGARKPLSEIARELGVDAFVEGSVVRSGNRVRINAQLIQVAPERHLWANAYERDMADIVALQGDVARAVATEIAVKLTPQEQTRLASARPVNAEAYEAYLKGRYFWEKRNEAAIKTAIEYFEQAIKVDPNFALAYAGLADAYNIAGFGVVASMPRAEAAARCKATAVKALELDGSLAEAHTALALLKEDADRDWAGAEVEFRRALELNPGYANAYLWYSQFLRQMGRRDEDFAMTRRALQLDPMSPIMLRNMGLALLWWGDIDQAIEQFRKALEIDPNRFNVLLALGWAYTKKGMYAEATAELQKALTLSPGNISAQGQLAYVYAVTGRRAEAGKILNELKRLPKERGASYQIALIYVGLGRNEEALGWLEKSVEDRSAWHLEKNWELDPLRKDPRFQELVRRAEMAENQIHK